MHLAGLYMVSILAPTEPGSRQGLVWKEHVRTYDRYILTIHSICSGSYSATSPFLMMSVIRQLYSLTLWGLGKKVEIGVIMIRDGVKNISRISQYFCEF